MTEPQLRQLLWRRNALQLITGISLGAAALIMWPISFWILRFLLRMPLALADLKNAGEISHYLAIGGMAIFVFEGLRYRRLIAANQEDCGESDFSDMLAGSRAGCTMNARFGNVSLAYGLVHFMLSAPRMTAQAIQAFRRPIRAASETIRQATIGYNRLAGEHRWIPISECPDCRSGMFLLDRLKLIWTRIEDGELQVRIPPGTASTVIESQKGNAG